MWFCGALFYFYEFIIQVSPNSMSELMMSRYNIGIDKFGLLTGIYFWSYSIMQIPAGILLDKYGPRIILSIASLLLGACCLMLSIVPNFNFALIARCIVGIASSFASIGCLKIVSNWINPRYFGLFTGLTVTVGMIGAIVGQQILSDFINVYDWKPTMIYLGYIGVIISIIFLLLVRDGPKSYQSSIITPSLKLLLNKILNTIKNKQLWMVAIYGTLMFSPSIIIVSFCGKMFFQTKFFVSSSEASYLCECILWGWIFGGPIGGAISDKIGLRVPVIKISALVSLICITLIIFRQFESMEDIKITLFIFGFFSAGFLPSFAIIKEISSNEISATSLGFMNMINTIGISIGQPLVGYLIHTNSYDTLNISGNNYTLESYQYALVLLPIMILISLIMTLFIKETYCKNIHEN